MSFNPTWFANISSNPILQALISWIIICLAILAALHIYSYLTTPPNVDDRIHMSQVPWPVPQRQSCDYFDVQLNYGRPRPYHCQGYVPSLSTVHEGDKYEGEDYLSGPSVPSQQARSTGQPQRGSRRLGDEEEENNG